MYPRIASTILLVILSGAIFAQRHQLPQPEGWESETFPFPISFAPGIPFKGKEEVRFAPGWADKDSEERWSYCFLWWVDEDANLNLSTLKRYLEHYYDGLIRSNLDSGVVVRGIHPTTAHVKLGHSLEKPFQATVSMLDYMTKKTIRLHVDVYMSHCGDNHHKAILFCVSPQPRFHPIWKQLASIREGFTCGD